MGGRFEVCPAWGYRSRFPAERVINLLDLGKEAVLVVGDHLVSERLRRFPAVEYAQCGFLDRAVTAHAQARCYNPPPCGAPVSNSEDLPQQMGESGAIQAIQTGAQQPQVLSTTVGRSTVPVVRMNPSRERHTMWG